jgi:zinc transport system substrate-binding protein
VLGDAGSAQLIVDGAASPHSYVLRPSDVRAINGADVVFRLSEALEPFTAKAFRALPRTVTAVTLADAPGIKALPRRSDPNFEAHAHAGAKGHNHAHNHKSGAAGARDPHVWLDTDNAKAMLDHIARTLAARDLAAAPRFAANAAAAKAGIDALAVDLAGALAPLAGRPYVVFHDATQYLEVRHGLKPVGAFVIDPDLPPSGKRLTELRRRIAALGPTCVFSEPNVDTRVVDAVIEGSPARKGTLDPEGAALPPGPGLYEALMRNLAAALRGCLLPSA